MSRYASASLSGSAVEELVARGLLSEFVSVCSSEPCTVTRVDVTADVLTDAAPRVAALDRRYPHYCYLAGKRSPTTRFLSNRPADGATTGSFYVGFGTDAAIKAVVYDKAWERLCKSDSVIPPTTRYEIKVTKRAKPCLADVLDPAPMFWHYARKLLPCPAAQEPWFRGRDLRPWLSSYAPRPAAAVMLDRVSSSPELAALASLAVDSGPHGVDLLCREVEKRLRKLAADEEARRVASHAGSSPRSSAAS
ncbi:hypothetical protein [Rubrivirga sp.]|uniref:hypothetical protein n=1 Tax=Rubrivirga sp. TaxID=1885344 RepID=UPI003C765715